MASQQDIDDRVTALALAGGRGDERALESFIRETQRDVWRFVAHLSSVSSADDLTQETFLRAIKSLPRFAAQSSARTWLLSIARRVVVDQVRSAMARPRIAHSVDWVDAANEKQSTSPRYEDVVEVNMLLSALEPERRTALVLTQVLGFSYAEAATICGCPIGTVRSRVARARTELLAANRMGLGEELG